MKTNLIRLVIGVSIFLFPCMSQAYACSCEPLSYEGQKKFLQSADFVFIGTVKNIESKKGTVPLANGETGKYETVMGAEIEVKRDEQTGTFKDAKNGVKFSPEMTRVYNPSYACDYTFKTGQKVVFAGRAEDVEKTSGTSEKRLVVSSCGMALANFDTVVK